MRRRRAAGVSSLRSSLASLFRFLAAGRATPGQYQAVLMASASLRRAIDGRAKPRKRKGAKKKKR